ncbi:hypothetical protein FRB90_002409, partial [Tulasnella sp. 427]
LAILGRIPEKHLTPPVREAIRKIYNNFQKDAPSSSLGDSSHSLPEVESRAVPEMQPIEIARVAEAVRAFARGRATTNPLAGMIKKGSDATYDNRAEKRKTLEPPQATTSQKKLRSTNPEALPLEESEDGDERGLSLAEIGAECSNVGAMYLGDAAVWKLRKQVLHGMDDATEVVEGYVENESPIAKEIVTMTRTHEPINTAQERAQILWAMCEYVVDVRKNTQATTEEREYVGEALMAALRLVSLMEGSPEPHEATQSLAEGKAMEQRPGRPQKTSSGRATARQKEETANDGRATNHMTASIAYGGNQKETKLLESVREASRAYFAGATTVQDLELLLSIMETAGANAVQTFKEQEGTKQPDRKLKPLESYHASYIWRALKKQAWVIFRKKQRILQQRKLLPELRVLITELENQDVPGTDAMRKAATDDYQLMKTVAAIHEEEEEEDHEPGEQRGQLALLSAVNRLNAVPLSGPSDEDTGLGDAFHGLHVAIGSLVSKGVQPFPTLSNRPAQEEQSEPQRFQNISIASLARDVMSYANGGGAVANPVKKFALRTSRAQALITDGGVPVLKRSAIAVDEPPAKRPRLTDLEQEVKEWDFSLMVQGLAYRDDTDSETWEVVWDGMYPAAQFAADQFASPNRVVQQIGATVQDIDSILSNMQLHGSLSVVYR